MESDTTYATEYLEKVIKYKYTQSLLQKHSIILSYIQEQESTCLNFFTQKCSQ